MNKYTQEDVASLFFFVCVFLFFAFVLIILAQEGNKTTKIQKVTECERICGKKILRREKDIYHTHKLSSLV